MELVKNWLDIVIALTLEDGYFIGGTIGPVKVGDVRPLGFGMTTPTRVIGMATVEEAARQTKRAEQLCGCELEPPPPDFTFFKAVLLDN